MGTWAIEDVNLAGVAARGTGGGYTEPATGAYKVRIADSAPYEKDGRTSVMFQTVIEDGDYSGTELRVFIGTDMSKVGIQRTWKTALLSAGMNPQLIENGTLKTLSDDQFANKTAFIYFKEGDPNAVEDRLKKSSKEFITPEAYASLTGNKATPKVANGTPTMNVAAAPQPGGSNKLRGMLQR